MKTFLTYCLIGCMALLYSCNRSSTKNESTGNQGALPGDSLGTGGGPEGSDSHTADASGAAADTLLAVLGGPAGQVRVNAGKSVGTLQLKAPSDTLSTLLGKADSVAVDMCKDLSAWQPDQARLRVYSLCDNDLDMRKSMQVIGLSGTSFSTAGGLSEKSTLAEIRQVHHGLRIAGKFRSAGGTLFIADQVEKGIAFELSDTSAGGRVLGVLVHLPGKPVTATTIPLYPDLE